MPALRRRCPLIHVRLAHKPVSKRAPAPVIHSGHPNEVADHVAGAAHREQRE
jgi:hypothetical protein